MLTGSRRGCNLEAVEGAFGSEIDYAKRQNLTVRMHVRRFTRLTNAFSKKLDNHKAAVALHYMHYNFARIHQTRRVTPAMEAGVSAHVWEIEEIVGLLDQPENQRASARNA